MNGSMAIGQSVIRTRPLPLERNEWAGLLRTLRFRHFKWDTHACGGCLVLPEAMVLPRAVHEEVVGIAESLHGALERFEDRARRDPAVLRRLAVPEPLHPLVAEEPLRALQCTRYDLFPTEDGRWMVSEFNEDVPGGFNEAEMPDLLGDPGDGLRWEGDLRAAFRAAMAPYERVALLYATSFSEDLQHMLILQRWLEEAGHRTVLASPAHLTRGWRRPRVLGEAVDAAFRFYPGEWMPKLPNFDVWRRVGPRLPMMNPLYRLVRQSKAVFGAWLDDPEISEADRALVERHCPRTLPFDSAETERYEAERERWVLKRAFGRMGDSVVIGALVSAQAWREALGDATRTPDAYSIQERFAVRSLDFAAGRLFPTVGIFLVNGRFAGYYSRAAAHPFLTHEAHHVATLVEGT